MGLLGSGWDDPQSAAIMALSAGLLQGNFGAGVQGASTAYADAKKAAALKQMQDMQMANYASEIDQRKAALAKQQQINDLLTQSLSPQATGMPSQPAMPGQLGSGSFGAVSPPAGMPSIPQPAPQSTQPQGSRIGNMPLDTLALLKANGLDLVDVAKLGRPDMQVSNGYAYDKNRTAPGFLPQMNVSQDGKASLVTIDPKTSLPVVSAPGGAFNTYAGYRNIDESAKANFDPVTVTPQGQNPQMTTRGALVANPEVSRRISPAEQAARDTDRTAILGQEVTKAKAQLNDALSRGDQSAAARAQADLAALNRELGGRRPTVGMPLQSEEEKQRASAGVAADSTRNVALAADAQKSKDTLSNIQEARRLLQQSPTSSGIGAMVDSGAGLFGASPKGADVAAKLDTLSGWMVSNVPRMEGPQSNFDVQNYKTMAGLVGDRTKPLSQRVAALDTLEKLQNKYSALNSGSNVVNSGGATGDYSQPKPGVINELPKTAPKGQRVRDTQTGKVLQFNGISWVEVK